MTYYFHSPKGAMSTYAVMQPYFLPYLGYWQMLNAVDHFVIYDDVQFSKGGYVNRNKLLGSKGPQWVTLSLVKSSLKTTIAQKRLDTIRLQNLEGKVESILKDEYRDFEFLDDAWTWWQELKSLGSGGFLGDYLLGQIEWVKQRLDISTEVLLSSSLHLSRDGDRVAPLLYCGSKVGSKDYVNSPGGRNLYRPQDFSDSGFQLHFFQPQLDSVAVDLNGERMCLSILDNIARLGEERVRELVKFGSIVKA